jgi:hypothetical protein
MYSLEDQLHRLTGEMMNLPRRECFIKIEDQRPFRTRTADLTPSFRSAYAKRVMLPIFLKNASTRSPYLFPAAEIDAAIAARSTDLLKPPPLPEPDFTAPVPIPVVDAPETFANDFWKRRTPPHDHPKPSKTRPGRRPDFRVVDGDKQD